jgi:hypothetical protein
MSIPNAPENGESEHAGEVADALSRLADLLETHLGSDPEVTAFVKHGTYPHTRLPT